MGVRKIRIDNLKPVLGRSLSVPKRYLFVGALGVVYYCLVLGSTAGAASYLHKPVRLTYKVANLSVHGPLELSFSQPVRGDLRYGITPLPKGRWELSRNVLGVTRLRFVPSQVLMASTTYSISVKNVQPILNNKPTIKEAVVKLSTEKAPGISTVAPADGDKFVPVTSSVRVTLAFTNRGIRQLVLTSSDGILGNETPSTKDDRTFVWNFKQSLKQGTSYHLELRDKNLSLNKQVLKTITFTTVPEPQILDATTTDHLYPKQPIVIHFAQSMILKNTTIKFDCNGSGSWQTDSTYSYVPATLAGGTACTYRVGKGATSKQGGVLEADKVFSVSAPGAVHVTSFTPNGSAVSLGSPIRITFDQPVDHASAQAAFAINPGTDGTFQWQNNTLIYVPKQLAYQTRYTVSVRPGVGGTYGLASTQTFSASFSTVVQSIKLTVPSYRQQYALSCEESSLRMALAYRGVMVGDMDILKLVGYNPHPRDTATNSWDNPYKMYVGDVNGQESVTGWGAYGPPIASASRQLGRDADYVPGITAAQVSQAIHDGNPVVLWGISAGATPRIDSWNTSDGVVQVAANAHVRTVFGVDGSPDNPVGFYLHDPLHPDIYWTTTQLENNMTANGLLGSQGVIVH